MEALAVMGFIFGLAALGRVLVLEKKLKDEKVFGRQNKGDQLAAGLYIQDRLFDLKRECFMIRP